MTPDLWTAILSLPHACQSSVERARALGPDAWLASTDPRVADDRAWVADHRAAPAEALALLAGDPSAYVRRFIACHPSTPAEALARLAEDTSANVRGEVARHPATRADTLVRLAADPDGVVRHEVAQHPSTPAKALAWLAEDPIAFVRREVDRRATPPAGAPVAGPHRPDRRRPAQLRFREIIVDIFARGG